MLETLLLVAIAVIGVQAVVITLLVSLVNKTREEKKASKQEARKAIRGLVRLTVELESDKEDYKDAYNKCYAEFKSLFKENKLLSKQYDKIAQMHGEVVNNLIVCIQEERLIKSKYMGRLIPYKFENMTVEELEQLLGDKIS